VTNIGDAGGCSDDGFSLAFFICFALCKCWSKGALPVQVIAQYLQ
jgi:hypothetical protein